MWVDNGFNLKTSLTCNVYFFSFSLGWIQLLGQCLSQGTDLYQETRDPSTLLSDVFSTCVTLLLSPQR